mgnify:CR=1 FL=1
MTACSFIGTAASVKSEITEFIRHFDIDEVIITSPIYDVNDKLYTIKAFAELMNEK